jgi:hypothetical protein
VMRREWCVCVCDGRQNGGRTVLFYRGRTGYDVDGRQDVRSASDAKTRML